MNFLNKIILALGVVSLFLLLPYLVKSVNTDNSINLTVDARYNRYWRPKPTPTATPKPTVKPTTQPSASPSPTPSASPSTSPSATPSSTPIPTPVSFQFGVVADDYMNAHGEVSSLAQSLGTKISTLSIFKQFGHPYNKDLSLTDLAYAKNNGIKIQLAWEPWNPDEGMNQSVDYLKDIPAGKVDTYIKSVETTIKNYGGPVSLRFGHEMNGDWYPWGHRPTEYIVAYRYIHDFFVKDGVTNVTWMWCPNVDITGNASALKPYYPGNDVVDVIGIDGFNFGTSQNYGGWQTFTQVFSSTYQYITTNYNTKPIIIAETASTELGGNKATWVKNMFATELPQNFPKIKELVWFNLLKETDWRVNSSAATLQAFQNAL